MYARTLNNEATILGAGVIGSNAGSLYQGGVSVNNTGTINANSSGNTLFIQVGGSVTNSSVAGGHGRRRARPGRRRAALNNAGGTISASGAGSTVLVNMEVQGGTLTTSDGGVIETGGSGRVPERQRPGPDHPQQRNHLHGGQQRPDRGGGNARPGHGRRPRRDAGADWSAAAPRRRPDVRGTRAVILSGSGAQIGGDSDARTLNNEVTIEGTGVIGSNVGALYQGGMSLNNSGIIDANVAGQTLTIQVGGGSVINSNVFEATGGGILNLAAPYAPLDNAGGTIPSSGAGSTVLVNMEVQGGTLTTSGGGVIETGGSGAFLDASAQGPITLSNGTTYTAGSNGLTEAVGTLDLGRGRPRRDAGASGQLQLHGGDLTFAGPGIVILSGAGAQIGGDGGTRTLNNEVTIEGTGVIGSNVGALYQGGISLNNSGIIDANVAARRSPSRSAAARSSTAISWRRRTGATLDLAAPSARPEQRRRRYHRLGHGQHGPRRYADSGRRSQFFGRRRHRNRRKRRLLERRDWERRDHA